MWDLISSKEPDDAYLNLYESVHFPDPVALSEVLGALEMVLGRHESLRSRYYLRRGEPVQRISDLGRIPVGVHEDPADSGACAKAALTRLKEMRFRSGEWPIRVDLVTRHGAVAHVVIVLCHLAGDRASLDIIADELRCRAVGATQAVRGFGEESLQPADLAQYESSAEGLRRSEVALEYWRDHFRRAPNQLFQRQPATHTSPAFQNARFESEATFMAIRILARRYRRPPASVLLAAIATAMGSIAQRETLAFSIIVATRWMSGARMAVGNFYQRMPVCISVDRDDFAKTIDSAWGNVVAASKHGTWDPRRFQVILREVQQQRGDSPDTSCILNLQVGREAWKGSASASDAETVTVALAASRYSWAEDPAEWRPRTFNLYVWERQQRTLFSLLADLAVISASETRLFFEAVESVLVSAVAGDRRETLVGSGGAGGT